MPTNDFLPFATGGGANVSTQAAWAALAARTAGFSSGVVRSQEFNKGLRQASFIASVVAQLVVNNSGDDLLDNGDAAAALASARKAVGGGGAVSTAGWQQLPGGLFVQWGTYSGTTGSLVSGVAEIAGIAVTFPRVFPSECFGVLATALDVSGAALQEMAWTAGSTTSGFTGGLSCRQAASPMTAFYIALGK